MKKIYVEITNSCNLNCKFCNNTNREKEIMSVENFEFIINQIKEYTNIICLHVKGEPLFYPDLDKVFKILEKNNLKTNITTNGSLLKFRLENLINNKAVRQINISLHSSTENENINTNVYMKRIFEAVDKLEESGIIISYRLWNLEEFDKNEKNFEIINLLQEKYNLKDLRKLLSENEWITIKDNIFINQDKQFIWPNMNEKILNESGRCLALKEQFGILVNGDVIPCCIDSEGELVLGNIFEQNIFEILNSKKAKEIFEGFKNNEVVQDLCKRCGFLYRLESKRKNRMI